MIKNWLIALEEKINAYEQRERILLFFSGLLAVVFIWYYLFYFSTAASYQKLVEQKRSIQTEVNSLNAVETVLTEALTRDPQAEKRRELARLTQRLTSLDTELTEMSVGLIPAKDLVTVLHDVLPQGAELSIRGASTHPPTNISFYSGTSATLTKEAGAASEAPDQTEKEKKQQRNEKDSDANVYKHLVTLELAGSYFSIVTYLERLEALPWRIYWQFLDYMVSDYPNATVYLGVYTLSADKGRLDE